MKLSEGVVPVSEAKAHTARLIERVVSRRCPAVITQNGRARAVLQDIRTYEETQESLAMLKIVAQGRRDIEAGKTKSLNRAFKSVRQAVRHRREAL